MTGIAWIVILSYSQSGDKDSARLSAPSVGGGTMNIDFLKRRSFA